MAYPHWLDSTERQIIDKVLGLAFAHGYETMAGDEVAPATDWLPPAEHERITDEVAATDITILRFRHADSHKVVGTIALVHGNGADVIHDFSERVWHIVDPALELAEKLANAS